MNVALTNRHVLEDRVASFRSNRNSDHLSIIRQAAIFSVLARRGEEAWVLEALQAISGLSVRKVGPAEWLVVSEVVGAESLARDLALLDAERMSFVDQSAGRTLLSLSGPNVRSILAKCVAVDLHPDVFAEGQAGTMLCCHVSANLARVAADSFEIIVMRSFAGAVFDEIMEMGRAFGLTAGFAD